MRIGIGQLAHETNTFSNIKTTLQHFKQWEYAHGEEIIHLHRGVKDFLGGMIDRGEEKDITIVPTFSSMAMPSGVITEETYEELKTELISSMKAAEPLDAVCLFLHGAGVTEGQGDLEGDLLKSLRRVIGYTIPLVVVLDLHANLSETMVKEADILIGNIEYPHVDSYERGIECIDLALELLTQQVKPAIHITKLPLLIPTTTSYHNPIKEINRWCEEAEQNPDVIDCTLYHGFPYSDVTIAGVSIVTVTNNNPILAKKTTEDLANRVWSKRKEFFPELLSPKEVFDQALSYQGPVILNEASDNPGAGTPGDGTFLLAEMIKRNLPNTCFGFIYDPEVAESAHQSGVGTVIQLKIGGKTDDLHGKPLSVKAYVKSLSDGKFLQTSPMWQGSKVDLGKSVRLQIGNVDVIVCSVRSQTFDQGVFALHGINVSSYHIVGLKSAHHFRAAYEPIAEAIITPDSNGLSSSNLKSYAFKNLQRIYPLDEVSFSTTNKDVKKYV